MTTTRTAPKVRTAIAMMNMGGPSTLDEVPSFLKNLFSDPEIIPLGPFQEFVSSMVVKRRSPKIQAQYAAIGGGSPIGKWTNHQGNAMCKILDEIRPESAPHKHYTMFRYANPLTEAALTEMKNDGAERAIAFSQYPQWSCTTTGSSMNHLWRELKRLDLGDSFQWSLIDRWNTHPGYIAAVSRRIQLGLEAFPADVRDKVVIMFSAHSVPMKVVYKGDPYTKEIASTSERVMEHLNVTNPHVLSWQSKVGYLPWMGPSTSNVIKGLASQGHKHVLAVPIAFTSDHIETLFEIDIEYAEEARELGIEHFKRSPSLNEEPLLAQAMADLVKDHLDSNTLHSPAYPLNCAGCENPTCRSIVNPIKPYARSRDVACGRPTSQSVHDLE
ncbi:ferrochelatase [Aphanomyces astaci]|uniref:Ferrochelatase n=1 Tax=Aphanomyces astaci TaxID=112090 RepID=W4GEE1_APHAT|nr:ferrochelatase [Aphanomyces astaci]ETV77338.1 ferrochelatase [Aphanomyces astaci]|eukprot:XP_009833125.1 ferrochelatase [Aphanomyces astaci]